jgi:hypothetical protein
VPFVTDPLVVPADVVVTGEPPLRSPGPPVPGTEVPLADERPVDVEAPLPVPDKPIGDPPGVLCRTIEVADSRLVAVAVACGGPPNGFPGAFAPWCVFAPALPALAIARQPAPTTPAENMTARPVHDPDRSIPRLCMWSSLVNGELPTEFPISHLVNRIVAERIPADGPSLDYAGHRLPRWTC